eukprot:Nk52_evm5s418 gene=Nk52_evmTU5s418
MNLSNTAILLCLALLLVPSPTDSLHSNNTLRGALEKLKDDVTSVAQFLKGLNSMDFQSSSSGALSQQEQQKELRLIINLVYDVARVIDNTTNSSSSMTHSHTGEHRPISLDELNKSTAGGYTNETTPVELPAFSSGDESQRVSGNSTNRTRAEILKSLNSTAVNAINSHIASWSAYYLRLSLLKHDLIGAKVLSDMGGVVLFHSLFNSTKNSHNEAPPPSPPADLRRGANLMGRIWRGLLDFVGRGPRPPVNREEGIPEASPNNEPDNEDYPTQLFNPADLTLNYPFSPENSQEKEARQQRLFELYDENSPSEFKRTLEPFFTDLIKQQAGDASVAEMTRDAQKSVLSLIEQIKVREESGLSSNGYTLKKQRLLELRAGLLTDKIDAPFLNALGKALQNPQETVQALLQTPQQQPPESEENSKEQAPSVQSILKTLPEEAERVVRLTKSLYEFYPTHHFGGGKENLPEGLSMSNNPLPSLDKIPSLVTQISILSTLENSSDLVEHQLAQVDGTLAHFTSAAKKSTVAASTEVYLHTPLELRTNPKEVYGKVAEGLIVNKNVYEPSTSFPEATEKLLKYFEAPDSSLIGEDESLPEGIETLLRDNFQAILEEVYEQMASISYGGLSSEKQECKEHFKEQIVQNVLGKFAFSPEMLTDVIKRVSDMSDVQRGGKSVHEVFSEMQEQSRKEAAEYFVNKLKSQVREEFFEQACNYFKRIDPSSIERSIPILLTRTRNGKQRTLDQVIDAYYVPECQSALVATGKVFFIYDMLDDTRFLQPENLDISDGDKEYYNAFCKEVKEIVNLRIQKAFEKGKAQSFDYANRESDMKVSKALYSVCTLTLDTVDRFTQHRQKQLKKDSTLVSNSADRENQLLLIQELVKLKVQAVSAADTSHSDLIGGLMQLTQLKMNAVTKSALEQVAQISSYSEETNSGNEQDVKVTHNDAVAFLSLGSRVSQSSRVEDVWHNAVNELLVEVDVHAALVGIQYYHSEDYDKISRIMKTHSERATSEVRSSLREYTKSMLKLHFEHFTADELWAKSDIEAISTFLSILQPDPITAKKIFMAVFANKKHCTVYCDYDVIYAQREDIIAKPTSGFVKIVEQEFWKNVDLENSDKVDQNLVEHFKQVGDLIQNHAVQRINELMRSAGLFKQNEGVESLEDIEKVLPQYLSPRGRTFFQGVIEYLQNNFATQYAGELKEKKEEIDEYDEFVRKEKNQDDIPPRFSEGPDIPLDEGGNEAKGDDDWKDSVSNAGDEQSQGGDEAVEASKMVD